MSDLQVTAMKEASPSDEDLSFHAIQILPGLVPHITRVSHAAVVYSADEMLDNGLRLKYWNAQSTLEATRAKMLGQAELASSFLSSEPSFLDPYRSAEGLKMFLLALGEHEEGSATMRLPPHVTQQAFVECMSNFMDKLRPTKENVKRYEHFEIMLAMTWDLLALPDALEATYHRWVSMPEMQEEAQGVFQKDQVWNGSYYCRQGLTSFTLRILKLTHVSTVKTLKSHGIFPTITGLVNFNTKIVKGSYTVTGHLEAKGRLLILHPVRWKKRPERYNMVGFQGVVSRLTGDGVRYAGTIPTIGCDSFELSLPGKIKPPLVTSSNWNKALIELVDRLESVHAAWREEYMETKDPVQTLLSEIEQLVR